VSDVEGSVHISVLLEEIVSLFRSHLDPAADLLFFDGTFGGGGHTQAILKAFPRSKVVAFDRDPGAVARAQSFQHGGRLLVIHNSFSALEDSLGSISATLGTQARFDGFLCDLGISSDQLEDPTRGFSFKGPTSLDMRMDTTQGITAAELLNSLTPGELIRILERGGVRRNAGKLANRIVDARPIQNAEQFIAICQEVLGSPRERRLRSERGGSDSHPATVPFQALRMEVNQELGEIETFLEFLPRVASTGSVAAFLTFHSLEDELITRRFRAWAKPESDRRFGELKPALGLHLSQKPILPSEEEILRNPRSRSARLRAFKFNKTEVSK
jgi:16S rRNA (cytosine1402-N4)-methyltransferase